MIRAAIADGADVYDLRGITDTLDARNTSELIQFKTGTGEAVETVGEVGSSAQPDALQGVRALPESPLLIPGRHGWASTLTVDGERWRRHLRSVADQTPGWCRSPRATATGFGLGRLAQGRLARRGHPGGRHVPRAAEVVQLCDGDLMVLTPWRSTGSPMPDGLPPRRVIHTVSRLADLLALLEQDPSARVVLERLTSMRRHGMTAEELRSAALLLERRPATVEGVALHLPLAAGAHLSEVVGLVNDVVAAELKTRASGSVIDSQTGVPAHVVRRLRGASVSVPTSGSATAPRCG
jgi:hypothetical protein